MNTEELSKLNEIETLELEVASLKAKMNRLTEQVIGACLPMGVEDDLSETKFKQIMDVIDEQPIYSLFKVKDQAIKQYVYQYLMPLVEKSGSVNETDIKSAAFDYSCEISCNRQKEAKMND